MLSLSYSVMKADNAWKSSSVSLLDGYYIEAQYDGEILDVELQGGYSHWEQPDPQGRW